MSENPYHFKVGQFECIIFSYMNDAADMELMKRRFPSQSPEEMEQAVNESGVAITATMNILYIRTPEHQILVDTGMGGADSQLLAGLEQEGIKREDIDGIVITHGDGDHIMGITQADGSLTFPNAQYDMWKSEWEHKLQEAETSDDPQNPARINLLPIKDRVNLIDKETEILPGIWMLPMPGHKIGHSGLLLESNGERLLHIVDAAHHPMQLAHPDWSPRFDTQPEIAIETRKAVFERASRENLLVLAYHFKFPGLGHITKQGEGLRWEAIKL